MKCLKLLTKVLLLVGGLNWGLVGALNMDLVAKLLGTGTPASRLVYCLVGVAALYKMVACLLKKGCCSQDSSGGSCCSR